MLWMVWGLLGVLVVTVWTWIIRREVAGWIKDQIGRSLKEAQENFLHLASQRLATERSEHLGTLEIHKVELTQTVQGLQQQLQRYEQLLREIERDRAAKYGSLEQQLTTAVTETKRLQQTTSQLTAILGNARVRGQWGEKTADDILKLCGLQESIHYSKQKDAPIGRPDFTFLLPDAHQCYMDVKFPLDNYLKLVNSEREEDQRAYKEQFLKDVRGHMKELERREYASSGTGAPDYVLMFIPNEQVYGAINEWLPGLIDEALRKRIVLCGPWTLYATVRLIWDAWQHYYHEQTIGEIIKVVSEFQGGFERFKDRFTELGKKLTEAASHHADIVRIDYAQLDRKIEQIKRYKEGEEVPSHLGSEKEQAALPIKELAHD